MKISWGLIAGLIVFLYAMLGGQPLGILAFLGLAAFSCLGYKEAIFALFLSAQLVIINDKIFPITGGVTSSLRWIVLIVASLSIYMRVFYERLTVIIWPLVFLSIFLIIALVVSNLFGLAPAVSNFKLLIFSLAGVALFQGYTHLPERGAIDRLLYHGICAFTIANALTILLFPFHAYRRHFYDGTINALKGTTNQSQVLGVMVAVAIAWLIARLMSHRDYRNGLTFLCLPLLGYFLLISKARTGMIALLLAGILVMFFALFRRNWLRRLYGPFFRPAVLGALILIALVGISQAGAILEVATDFALKSGRNGDDLREAFEASRGERIRELYHGYQERKYTGLGFGMPRQPEHLKVGYDPLTGVIPIRSETEKNFLFMAVFQETGLFGGIAFFVFLGSMVTFQYRYGSPGGLFVFLTGLMLNVGEAIFFSLGGAGLFVFVIMSSSLLRASTKEPYATD